MNDMCVRCGGTEAEHPGSTFINTYGEFECPRFEPFAPTAVRRLVDALERVLRQP